MFWLSCKVYQNLFSQSLHMSFTHGERCRCDFCAHDSELYSSSLGDYGVNKTYEDSRQVSYSTQKLQFSLSPQRS